jgi:thiamine-phosphate pyrophosphorylase
LLINDRIDVALAAGAGGVHLPADSFCPRDARSVLGHEALIGVSTHGVSDARSAAAAGADYVIFGPVYDTPSKQAYGPPLGLDALAEVVETVPIPVLAIGGITPDRVSAVRARGTHGVAVISAILSAGDPRAASRALRDGLDGIR